MLNSEGSGMNLFAVLESSETIRVLLFLLPGFVAAGVFQALISNPKPNGIEVIVQAFVFTMFVQLSALPAFSGIEAIWPDILSNDKWKWGISTSVLVLVAVMLGLIAACTWNRDWLHRHFREWGLTRESSYRSAQYSAFANHRDCFVVLHLKGERRLYGWPQEWPSRVEDQHFLMIKCEWLKDENKREPLEGVSHMLVSASEVEMIEFLPMPSGEQDTE